jgi:hypothetical protein
LFLSTFALTDKHILITGDFIIHFDRPTEAESKKFIELLHMFDLNHHVNEPTHFSGHILDFIITKKDSNLISNTCLGDFISDHCAILTNLSNGPIDP